MVDHLYNSNCDFGGYTNGDGDVRQLNQDSTVIVAEYIVGLPLNIEVRKMFGKDTLKLVTMATKVTPEMMRQVAPHLLYLKQSDWRASSNRGYISFTQAEAFNGVVIGESENRELSWAEIVAEFPDYIEQIRQEVIDLQVRENFPVGGAPKTIDLEAGDWRIEYKPRIYGYDPATGEDLIAYPAVLKIKMYFWCEAVWYLQFFKTEAEAKAAHELSAEKPAKGTLEALRSLNLNLPAGPINPPVLPKKPKLTATAPKPPWEPMGNRWWRCPNGHSTRVAKNETKVVCGICWEEHEIV
jgi:hypothetical protein